MIEMEKEQGRDSSQEERNEENAEIREMGTLELEDGHSKHGIQLLTIIGEIEGHEAVSGNTKATKYEHLLPRLAEAEEDEDTEGVLILLNTLGGDVEAGLALAELFPLPGISADCGTALTLEIVDADGVFRGGAIAPGRAMMRRSLAAGTAQLPEIPFSTQLPEHPGSNTVETIRFGVDRGAVGLMRELLSASLPACGKARRPTIVATGGDAPIFAEALGIRTAPEDFTLRGILRAFLSRIS